MLDMDITRQPRRVSEWAAVLDAVHRAAPEDEQTWLEWKSTLDLRSKEAVASTVCKTIIAMANRDPDAAARTVGGIGILIIGLEPGNVVGVDPVDNADLDALTRPFIGADGPIWTPHWETYQGKRVLIIEVDPPRWGDPIHCFRRQIGSIRDGMPYVRGVARSDPADHKELARLAGRFAARPQEHLDIDVSQRSAPPLSKYTWEDHHLDGFLEILRGRLMKPLAEERSARRDRNPQASDVSRSVLQNLSGSVFGGTFPGVVRESRTEAEYEGEIREYLKTVRAAWPDVMREAAVHVVEPPTLILTNRTTRNYQEVAVVLHVAGTADAAEYDPDTTDFDLESLLPEPPRSWGPRNMLHAGFDIGRLAQPVQLARPVLGPTIEIERGGSFTLTFPPVHLRPQQRYVLTDEWSFLIPATRTEPVTATWTATATNADGPPASGTFTIPFDGPDINVFQAVLDPANEQ